MLSNIGLNLSSLKQPKCLKNKIKIIKDYIRIAKKLNITGLEFYHHPSLICPIKSNF